MTVQPEFDTLEGVRQAYFGSSDSGGGSNDDGGGKDTPTWGKLQRAGELEGGWLLSFREATNSQQEQWFVTRAADGGGIAAIAPNGEVRTYKSSASLGNIVHYDGESAARSAHQKWLDSRGEKDRKQSKSSKWSKWKRLKQIGNWYLLSREHKQKDRTQYVVAGQNAEGTTIFLWPKGKVRKKRHIYESLKAINKALKAYRRRVTEGKVPESKQPTGEVPSKSAVRKSKGGGALGGLVSAAANNPLLVAGVGAAGVVAYTQFAGGAGGAPSPPKGGK